MIYLGVAYCFFQCFSNFPSWVLGKLDRIFSCFLVNLFVNLYNRAFPNSPLQGSTKFAIPCAAMALEVGSPATSFTPQVVLFFNPSINLYICQ